MAKAPPQVVEKERARLADLKVSLSELEAQKLKISAL